MLNIKGYEIDDSIYENFILTGLSYAKSFWLYYK